MMRTLMKLAACSMAMLAWGASDVEAKCTARDKFTLELKSQLQNGEEGVQLLDTNGQPLGCWLPTNKALGEFCVGADDKAKSFDLTLKNSCQKPIKAVVHVAPKWSILGTLQPMIFTGDKDCLDALEDDGKPLDLVTNESKKLSCKTKKYKKSASSPIVYTAHYSVDVTQVGGSPTSNGLYDPRIAVERDGDVSTMQWFSWWAELFAGLGVLVASAVAGWFGRRWWSGRKALPAPVVGGQPSASGSSDTAGQ